MEIHLYGLAATRMLPVYVCGDQREDAIASVGGRAGLQTLSFQKTPTYVDDLLPVADFEVVQDRLF